MVAQYIAVILQESTALDAGDGFHNNLKRTHRLMLFSTRSICICCDKTHWAYWGFPVSVTTTKRRSLVSVGIDPEPTHRPQQGWHVSLQGLSSYLNHYQLPLPGFSIRPFFSKTEVDLIWWLFLNLSFLMGNQL